MKFNFRSWWNHGIEIENSKKLDIIIELLQTVIKKEIIMSKELDALTVEVAKTTDVTTSAITLLKGLAVQISALKLDPVALQALADQLNVNSKGLADAVVENTPVATPVV
jgi:hypothetical protein